jgi:Xaa-Pro aminopeptidase
MAERASLLAERLAEVGADLALVTSLVNVRYLTGYTGSNGLALVGPDTRVFITDFRYVEQSAAEVEASFERRIAMLELTDAITEFLPEGEVRLAFEDADLSVRAHARLRELLPERVELVSAGDLVEPLRAIKGPDEIQRIREATEIADAGLRQVMETGLIGRTEVEVAAELERSMREHGARGASFEAIVAAGPHGALPHAQPRPVKIGAGELVVIDWGAEFQGYCSDCTRTLATGDLEEQAQVAYELVRAAQLAGLEALTPGVSGRDADAAARAVIEDGGYGEYFGHGLGHGVGLEIHEAPRLSQRSDSILAAGNVVTVEPGVYLPGRFGVRIEDLVVVTDSGREILTSVPKELIVVD